MDKINVVLVVLDKMLLERAVKNLNFERVHLAAIVAPGYGEKVFYANGESVPVSELRNSIISKNRSSIWMIHGSAGDADNIRKIKKFLRLSDVPEANIINFTLVIPLNWVRNLRHIEKYGADFFVTGTEYIRDSLDLKLVPQASNRYPAGQSGVNLADSFQDLQQSYWTAKYIFGRVKRGTIKFVLIGLTPDIFRYDNAKDFPNCSKNLMYLFTLKNSATETEHDKLLKTLINSRIKSIFDNMTAKSADLSFDSARKEIKGNFSTDSLAVWDDDKSFLSAAAVEKNVKILRDYVQLCIDRGAKPVGVIFPPNLAVRKNYGKDVLNHFREVIRQLEKNIGFTCIDLFETRIYYDSFCDMTHMNARGRLFINSLLSARLHKNKLVPAENFLDMNYDYFHNLSWVTSKVEYAEFMDSVFEAAAKNIRSKDKIKVGFVLYDAALWCGDKLYNYFAQNERFETTIFMCLRTDKPKDELVLTEFWYGVKQLKKRGFNVTAINKRDAEVPEQDLLIFLTPYFNVMPDALRTSSITAKTLMAYIPYGISVSCYEGFNLWMFDTAWKVFFTSKIIIDIYEKKCHAGAPRGVFGGYPRADVLMDKNQKLSFDWKMARPNAKKIIWAPHWTINDSINYATFQWNYQFMYEFAKAHPETSWVLKPHPNLLFSAVKEKVFASSEEFQEYLDKWEALPNAMVYMGAYYQEVFATSDGMILDSSSFVAEYQYTHKPLIFLTRDTQEFNELGEEILKVSYLVDGQNLDGIADLIQQVFIKKKDKKYSARKKIFDEHLNFQKINGMSASEFVYKSIAEKIT